MTDSYLIKFMRTKHFRVYMLGIAVGALFSGVTGAWAGFFGGAIVFCIGSLLLERMDIDE